MPANRHWPAAVAAVCLLLAGPAVKASEEKKAAALTAAQAWLALVDAGDYGGSWDSAASFFKTAVGPDQWRQSMEAYRRPLGGLVTREVGSATYLTEAPGAPDGHYVVIEFDTSFENKRSAVETVTPMQDADGAWRVSGYYIK